MAVKSRKTEFSVMEHIWQEFCIGQMFWFSPKCEPTVELLLEVRPTSEYTDSFGCTQHCALSKWCISAENLDENGLRFKPACSDLARTDNEEVYFKRTDSVYERTLRNKT